MFAEVCAYLTVNKYFELPAYRVSYLFILRILNNKFYFKQKPLVNFTLIFCLVIFIGMCLVGIGVVTHADWKYVFDRF